VNVKNSALDAEASLRPHKPGMLPAAVIRNDVEEDSQIVGDRSLPELGQGFISPRCGSTCS